jgi:uncharacterized protein
MPPPASSDGRSPDGQHPDPSRSLARVVLRPIANPLPLSFLALGAATFLLSAPYLGLVEGEDSRRLGIILVAFAFPLHAVAAVFGFLAREGVGSLTSALFGGAWLTTGVLILTSEPDTASAVNGIFYVTVAVLIMVPATAAAGSKILPAVVLAATGIRFAVAGMYELTGAGGLATAAGVLGVPIILLSIYVALSLALEDTERELTLPLWRHGEGEAAMAGGLSEQLELVERDAGVRRQL